MVSGGENRFEASFRAPVLHTQGRRARARGCRVVRTGCRFQDTASGGAGGDAGPRGASLVAGRERRRHPREGQWGMK